MSALSCTKTRVSGWAKPTLLAASLPLVAGCATPTIVPTDAAKVASAIGHVAPSKSDTCETQKALAAQSSRIDTIIQGKEVVYKADCTPPQRVASSSKS